MIALINLPSLGESVDPAAASSKKGSTDRGSEPVAAEETQPAGLVFALPDPRSLLALMPAILSTSEKRKKRTVYILDSIILLQDFFSG